MRNDVIGVGLAATLLGALFFAASHRAVRTQPAPDRFAYLQAVRAAGQSVQKGFVGIKRVGDWTVACAAKPLVLSGRARDGAASPAPPKPGGKARTDASPQPAGSGGAVKTERPARQLSLGRCRSLIEFRHKDAPKDAALAVIFRAVGPAPGKLAVFVRLPAAHKGEKVGLRMGKGALQLPVRGCSAGACSAFGILSPVAEGALEGATVGELVLPPGRDGKRKAVRLPLAGLPASLSAMRRAQS